jgi:hypothetical protein
MSCLFGWVNFNNNPFYFIFCSWIWNLHLSQAKSSQAGRQKRGISLAILLSGLIKREVALLNWKYSDLIWSGLVWWRQCVATLSDMMENLIIASHRTKS